MLGLKKWDVNKSSHVQGKVPMTQSGHRSQPLPSFDVVLFISSPVAVNRLYQCKPDIYFSIPNNSPKKCENMSF